MSVRCSNPECQSGHYANYSVGFTWNGKPQITFEDEEIKILKAYGKKNLPISKRPMRIVWSGRIKFETYSPSITSEEIEEEPLEELSAEQRYNLLEKAVKEHLAMMIGGGSAKEVIKRLESL